MFRIRKNANFFLYRRQSIATLLFLKLFIQEIGLNIFEIFKANRNSLCTLQINKRPQNTN